MSRIDNFIMNQKDAKDILIDIFSHLGDWPIRSAEAFRNALLGEGMFAINPMLELKDEHAALMLKETVKRTVAEGRMINFGFIPNDLIKQESVRSRDIFEAGELQHPYNSWLGISSWEGGFNGYHVSVHPDNPRSVMILELYGVNVPYYADAILLYDAVSLEIMTDRTMVSPHNMNYPSGHEETEMEIRSRGSNSLDPLVTMLRLLADASIPITHSPAPDRLNKARLRQGKPPIPSHSIVHTKSYVANFQTYTHTERAHSKGGHHASPVAHWRRAHRRHLNDGRIIPVKSSKVNWRDNEEFHRLFYNMQPSRTQDMSVTDVKAD